MLANWKTAAFALALCAATQLSAQSQFTIRNVPAEAQLTLNGAPLEGTYDVGRSWMRTFHSFEEGDVIGLTAPLFADLSLVGEVVVDRGALSRGTIGMSAQTHIPEGADPAESYGIPFTDCAGCPSMVIVPGGSFTMGAGVDEAGADESEYPRLPVEVATFAISQSEITFEQWAICTRNGGCNGYNPHDEGYGSIGLPVINVGYEDAVAYTQWLSTLDPAITYRLPTEEEWEYAARARTETPFWIGAEANRTIGNYAGTGPRPIMSYAANNFDVFDVSGNVWEWVADCWTETHADPAPDTCEWRTQRGGSWTMQASAIRSANRRGAFEKWRHPMVGFRVLREFETPATTE